MLLGDTLAPLSLRLPDAGVHLTHLSMPVTIRSRLLLLVLSVVLPGMLGVAWLIGSTYEAERDAHNRTLRDTARALSMLVDSELARRATIAHVLSQSPELDGAIALEPERRQAFEQQARRTMQGLDGWVELHAPGRVLLSTRLPQGSRGDTSGPATLRASALMLPLQPLARAAGDPSPSDELYAAWVEPVRRNGELLYNIVVTVRPSELQRIVQAQANPGWIGTVMDSAGRVVARQPGGAAFTGRAVGPQLRERMANAREGLFQLTSLDGSPTVGYFSTSPLGWSYVSAMPREAFAGRMPAEVLRVVVGALTLTALAVAGAMWVARRIEQPIRALKTAAQDLQAGRQVQTRPTGIAECDEVAEALASAGRTMAGARSELERSVAQAVDRTRLVEQRGAQSQRVEALGRLTGGVAHEFNNLLGIISNSMHLMRRHAAADELQAPLAATQRAVDKGSQLTQHLLRFSGRRPGMRMQTVLLGRYLPEVQELLRSVLGRRIDIRVQVAPSIHAVRVDASELDLALVNLALNAHDAMPNGGELCLRAGNATADDLEGLALPPGDYVVVTVSDDGIGMDEELAGHAFEPFFTTKPVGQGSGLGLCQVYGFATQAGGTARLSSTPSIGTTVSLLLPVAGAGGDDRPEAFAPPSPQGLAGATVLLVEDDESLGDVTAALLMAHGARVIRAAHAEAALRLLDAGAAIDIVLSDIVMPGSMDGVALARRLREQRQGLPVVLITGFSNTAMSDGEFPVLRKPCPPDELLAALQASIAIARSASPPQRAR
ncbi:response regulator [Roseateles cellulosilyticus]|uniref:histidine kinase n=1 Tax=Pelomonas cellulosilytica TaxID=2906762 RepID=A0ABS8XQJ1_9BURK|nr:response regulator [Pelomonas sp. P8]MCE4553111.1 response regulator [Pelomonas sp. P8]